MLRIGIDIGGTFTDFAVWNGEAAGYTAVAALKVPSTPPHFAAGVQRGLEALLAQGRIRADQEMLIVHGTTVSTNAVIERSGPPLALLVTAGFRDILGVARLRLDRPVDLFARRPAPLIPRHRVHEIDERILADGSIDRPLDPDGVVAAARAAIASGAAAIAVCFLHAYRNPAHEQAAGAAIRAALGDVDVVLSHEVWPQQSEYERASAALLNAYARRAMSGYIAELEGWLATTLPKARLLVTKSNGGVMAAGEATRMPIHTLLSGPAAGVTASAALGAMLGEANLLTMDMGGTSTDISMIRDGRIMVSHDGRVGEFPLMMPVTAIEAIGAGGGSIAWLDGPVLKVGPRSAGAAPGPACYGRGGTLPTVSDAYLLCGYLSEDAPLAGGLHLHRALADTAMAPIAATLSRDSAAAAEAVLAVATANMLANALPFIARLGVAPAELTLMIFGGAGAIHGPLLADEIGIGRVVIPRVASVFCAYGCLVSDLLYDVVRSVHGEALDAAAVAAIFAGLRGQGADWLAAQAGDAAPAFEYAADIRYAGQSFDVSVGLDASTAERGDLAAIAAAFHAEHGRLFGHASPRADIEIMALRLRVRGNLPRPGAVARPLAQGTPPHRTRRARFAGAWHDTPLFAWADLPVGWRAAGPAIIEQETATVVVPPAFTVAVGPYGDLVLDRER
ncbi:hydantoinase/oxoprolinase family protein [Limobrevibacterium gyesilva]|uniref:Hydantoinase/oxoprolinase family protein n=1 Tax=Limobrevibacterium gyesilva TaxID=2991712 RepID=A0AA41YKT4_9PROT|nr:hydantoinase/oxoprolinase family protein [Limobrevibacterium gyesilva]MCW3475611.1 hydantoinase/oxoprolinase family protein [Limobrevibacterium gyesilva]